MATTPYPWPISGATPTPTAGWRRPMEIAPTGGARRSSTSPLRGDSRAIARLRSTPPRSGTPKPAASAELRLVPRGDDGDVVRLLRPGGEGADIGQNTRHRVGGRCVASCRQHLE